MKTKVKALTTFALCMIMVFCLAGCSDDTEKEKEGNKGNDKKTEQSNSDDSSKTDAKEPAGYVFESNGTTFGVDMDMAEVAAKLGEPKSEPFEAPSCAGQGTAIIYDYGSFEIETYPKDDKNLISFIILKDDTVATKEGIDLSKSKDDIIEAYGENYTENDNGLTYSKDGMKLNFILDGDSIKSIEYVSSVAG